MADDTALGLNMAVMADLVQEKMCDLSEADNGLYHLLIVQVVKCLFGGIVKSVGFAVTRRLIV